MAVAASDILNRAGKALGILGGTEVFNASESNDGLIAFNAMLDSLSLEGLMSYVVQEQSFSLQIGTNSYTIGSGGVINVARPKDIVQAYVQDSGNNNFPMNILTRDTWNNI